MIRQGKVTTYFNNVKNEKTKQNNYVYVHMSMNHSVQQEHQKTKTNKKGFLKKNEEIISTEVFKILKKNGWSVPMPKLPGSGGCCSLPGFVLLEELPAGVAEDWGWWRWLSVSLLTSMRWEGAGNTVAQCVLSAQTTSIDSQGRAAAEFRGSSHRWGWSNRASGALLGGVCSGEVRPAPPQAW